MVLFLLKNNQGNDDLLKTYFNFSLPIDLAKNYSKQKIKRKIVIL